MSADGYRRVTMQDSIRKSFLGYVPAIEFVPDDNGTHKVVPADAIVIERGDLPEVRESKVALGWVSAGPYDASLHDDRTDRRAWALAYLAVDEHLRANPPVDEAQVKRITAALLSTRKEYDGKPIEVAYQETARRLYLAGVRAPEVTE